MSRKNTQNSFPFALVSLISLAGCAAAPLETAESEGDLGVAQQAIGTHNGLPPSALLGRHDIAYAPLSLDSIPQGFLAAIEGASETSGEARLFLEYAVGCAFTRDQTFDFSWTDARGTTHEESFVGDAGLAPTWADSPLGDAGQQWISACLAARTNLFGKYVAISMRGPAAPIAHPDAAELEANPHEEGAFWGNLFADEPFVQACHVDANVNRARAAERECATGHVTGDLVEGCGIIEIVGSCDELCSPLVMGGAYHPGCGTTSAELPSPQKTKYVITVFLP
jgi:hypothetical protein